MHPITLDLTTPVRRIVEIIPAFDLVVAGDYHADCRATVVRRVVKAGRMQRARVPEDHVPR